MVQIKQEYYLVALGAVGWLTLAHFVPSIKKLNLGGLSYYKTKDEYANWPRSKEIPMLSVEQIPGIDLVSLNLCRSKGLL